MLPPSLEEKEPGVYVRSNKPDNDLDFLWDKERKKHIEHDRFHLGFFLGGAVFGSLVTLAITFVMMSGGKLFHQPEFVKPTVEEQTLVPADTKKPETAEKPAAKKPHAATVSFLGAPIKTPEAAAKPADTAKLQAETYQVKSGDTMGAIARKFYHSGDPALVDKITHANQLKSADSLQLGQKLIIPPKSY